LAMRPSARLDDECFFGDAARPKPIGKVPDTLRARWDTRALMSRIA
jgi:hypothetical protein